MSRDSKVSSLFTYKCLTYIGPEIVKDPVLSGSPCHPPLSFSFNGLHTNANIHMNTRSRIKDCCLHFNFQGDIIAGIEGRPPSYSDMVGRLHYLKRGSFIWVHTSLCLVVILPPRHTHFSHWLLWKSFTPQVQIKTEWGAWASQEVWKIPALNEFIWFHLHCFLLWLFLYYSSKVVFFFFVFAVLNIKTNEYAVSNTGIIDNFWNVILSIGTIAENTL